MMLGLTSFCVTSFLMIYLDSNIYFSVVVEAVWLEKQVAIILLVMITNYFDYMPRFFMCVNLQRHRRLRTMLAS